MKILVVAHWSCIQRGDEYFLPSTHISYLDFLIQRGNQVLVACVVRGSERSPRGYGRVPNGIEVYSLPRYASYWDVYFHIITFFKFTVRHLKQTKVDLVYVRAPDPMAWLFVAVGAVYSQVNLHFVGDSIEATLAGKGGVGLRFLKSVLYLPEYIALLLSAHYGAKKVFANGPHLVQRLKKLGVRKAEMVISSTVSANEMFPLEPLDPTSVPVKFVYVGYLRAAKGLEELLEAFGRLASGRPAVELSLVGDGDFRSVLSKRIEIDPVLRGRVQFYGHVDDRERLREILRSHDFFCFFSRSEGSPRVVIEAMAEGLPVIATQVGSLPFCFRDNIEILFTTAFTSDAVYGGMVRALRLTMAERDSIRISAYDRVRRDFLKDKFLGRIFS